MTHRTTPAAPQRPPRTGDANADAARAPRATTGPANRGSPAASVMKQSAKTAAERGEATADAVPRQDDGT